jgi:hypothetical protein
VEILIERERRNRKIKKKFKKEKRDSVSPSLPIHFFLGKKTPSPCLIPTSTPSHPPNHR